MPTWDNITKHKAQQAFLEHIFFGLFLLNTLESNGSNVLASLLRSAVALNVRSLIAFCNPGSCFNFVPQGNGCFSSFAQDPGLR